MWQEGGIHAREWIATSSVLYIGNSLLQDAADSASEVQRLLRTGRSIDLGGVRARVDSGWVLVINLEGSKRAFGDAVVLSVSEERSALAVGSRIQVLLPPPPSYFCCAWGSAPILLGFFVLPGGWDYLSG